jgi:hypothetical protein
VKPNPPIKGHELIAEGNVGRRWMPGSETGGCRCGARPAEFPDVSQYAMRRWHRQHKAELRGEL